MLELLYHFLVPDASVFDADGNGREPPPMVSEEFTIDMLDPSQQLPDYDMLDSLGTPRSKSMGTSLLLRINHEDLVG